MLFLKYPAYHGHPRKINSLSFLQSGSPLVFYIEIACILSKMKGTPQSAMTLHFSEEKV